MKLKMIKPMFTEIVTTAERYIDNTPTTLGGIIDVTKLKTGLREYQTVVAVGDAVRNIQVGDLVCIKPDRFAVDKNRNSVKEDILGKDIVAYEFPTIQLNGVDHLLIDSTDIKFIITDYEK